MTSVENNSIYFPIILRQKSAGKAVGVPALIDSGSTSNLISKKFADQNKLRTVTVKVPYTLTNADGTKHKKGPIIEVVWAKMLMDGKQTSEYFLVAELDEEVVLGCEWLKRVNPEIDWTKGELVAINSRPTGHRSIGTITIASMILSEWSPQQLKL